MAITYWIIIKKIANAWSEDNVPRLSAALAYYTIFSITPLLIIGVALLGLFLGTEASRGHIVDYISGSIGHEAGLQIQNMIISASKPKSAKIAQLAGVIMLIVGATGVFRELKSGLNTIWGVKAPEKQSWADIIKNRVLSFLIVLGSVFLLLASLVLDIILSDTISDIISHHAINLGFTISTFSRFFSFLVITMLFAIMFKILPETTIKWRAVWLGAIITSILFNLGKFLLGIYLSFSITSIYGASGSLVVLLIWVYYTSQIFFIGAEISKVISIEKSNT